MSSLIGEMVLAPVSCLEDRSLLAPAQRWLASLAHAAATPRGARP
jgi:hypothetical protein